MLRSKTNINMQDVLTIDGDILTMSHVIILTFTGDHWCILEQTQDAMIYIMRRKTIFSQLYLHS